MAFHVSSPDTFLLSQDGEIKKMSKNSRIAIALLAALAVGIQIMNFVIVNNFIQSVGTV